MIDAPPPEYFRELFDGLSREQFFAWHDAMTQAISDLSAPIPGTKGMGPRDRANRLHAELERRIAIAKGARQP